MDGFLSWVCPTSITITQVSAIGVRATVMSEHVEKSLTQQDGDIVKGFHSWTKFYPGKYYEGSHESNLVVKLW